MLRYSNQHSQSFLLHHHHKEKKAFYTEEINTLNLVYLWYGETNIYAIDYLQEVVSRIGPLSS